MGCHTAPVNEDVLGFGLSALIEAGFTLKDIIQAVQVFSHNKVDLVRKVTEEVGTG